MCARAGEEHALQHVEPSVYSQALPLEPHFRYPVAADERLCHTTVSKRTSLQVLYHICAPEHSNKLMLCCVGRIHLTIIGRQKHQ